MPSEEQFEYITCRKCGNDFRADEGNAEQQICSKCMPQKIDADSVPTDIGETISSAMDSLKSAMGNIDSETQGNVIINAKNVVKGDSVKGSQVKIDSSMILDSEVSVDKGDVTIKDSFVSDSSIGIPKDKSGAKESSKSKRQKPESSSLKKEDESMPDEIKTLIDKAEQGDTSAMFDLGQKDGHGDGVEKNYEQAVYWFSKAAEHGDSHAEMLMNAYLDKMK